ncbi:DUF3082 domain-containing protein [Gloeocapsopsis crepidinum LEGE 06123]|uniref:DUF3082 domain-containing protein n=1 Tax=Gloeocapsopsis crepidinum LEGE 06123 TaxID=588587 RepID=A0ABR9UR80_9CHRO|nr:DUF3082 domain-containing protein [Gloeocapsopsis crepidinum]MBE9190558.1 DUF3082 domain-containing protein [Gloeocapsopsis crepidinum LEGE 06123]
MNNQDKTDHKPTNATTQTPTPLRCLTGSLISGGLAIALYSLTAAIAQTFAAKPIHSDNPAVINIASAVRTLVVGITALGTGIFGLVALGLIGLAIQILIQQATKKGSPS